ncbi:hypothetical protein Ancab_030866 [Ancistrocladus abbreviatus]
MSTHKRQKQYFEQRKWRQQQQTSEVTENYGDGLSTYNQHQNNNRSLDILSFLNVPEVAKECKYNSPEEVDASAENFCKTKSLPAIITNKVSPGSFLEALGSKTPSSQQVETMPLERSGSTCFSMINSSGLLALVPLGTSNSANHIPKTRDNEAEYWKNAPSHSINSTSEVLSVFDLIGDDGTSDDSEGTPVCEAHVAFSIEGLGKLGTETPIHSPQQPCRTFLGAQSSLAKPDRHCNSFKNFGFLGHDLESKVVRIVSITNELYLNSHDVGAVLIQLAHGLELKEALCLLVLEPATVLEMLWFANRTTGPEGHINVSQCLKESTVQGNNVLFDCNYIDSGCQGRGLLNSFSCRKPELLSIEDQLELGGKNCKTNDDAQILHDTRGENDTFWDATSSFLNDNFPIEDYDITWKSGGSADIFMRSEGIADTPPVRGSRRCSKALHGSLENAASRNNYPYRTRDVVAQEGRCEGSGKFNMTSNPSRVEQAYFPEPSFMSKLGHDDCWSFEDRLPSVSINSHLHSHLGSFYQSSKKDDNSPRCTAWADNQINRHTVPDLHFNSEMSFGRSKHDTSVGCTPLDDPSGPLFSSVQSFNSSFFSKSGRGRNRQDIDFEINVESSESSEVAGLYKDMELPTSELSGKGSVSKAEGNKSKGQMSDRENFKPEKEMCMGNNSVTSENRGEMVNSNSNQGSVVQNDKDVIQVKVYNSGDAEESSVSLKVADKSDSSSVNEKESQSDTLALSQHKIKDPDVDGSEGSSIASEEEEMSVEPSGQLMMLESYILQFLCVQKAKKPVHCLEKTHL